MAEKKLGKTSTTAKTAQQTAQSSGVNRSISGKIPQSGTSVRGYTQITGGAAKTVQPTATATATATGTNIHTYNNTTNNTGGYGSLKVVETKPPLGGNPTLEDYGKAYGLTQPTAQSSSVNRSISGKIPQSGTSVQGDTSRSRSGKFYTDEGANPYAAGVEKGTQALNDNLEQSKHDVANETPIATQKKSGGGGVPNVDELYAQVMEAIGQQYAPGVEQPLSFEDYLAQVGADDYQKNIESYVRATVENAQGAYEDQIEQAEKDAREAARQAYVARRLEEQNMDQVLAANGIYGGAADSQRIAQESEYQARLQAYEEQRQQTVAELRRAIENAQLLGDQQAAQMMSDYLQSVQQQYAGYYQQFLDYSRERALRDEQLQQELALQQVKAAARAASSGQDDYVSETSEVNTQVPQGTREAYRTRFYGEKTKDTAADYGQPSSAQIMQMQNAIGVTPTGTWDSNTVAATGVRSAKDAWRDFSYYMQ